MTNDDLKRFYDVNPEPERNRDFVRYGKDGELITEHDATKNEEVVNYRTLIKHAGGAGADINYRKAWVSGMQVAQYDLVYVDTLTERTFYMASNNIASSTISPASDTDNWIEYLAVERDARTTELPEASELVYGLEFQYIGETDSNYTNSYFYKCERNIAYWTIVGVDESTYYCAELPELGESVQLYTDNELTTEATGKTLRHITTGYEIITEGSSDTVNTTQTATYDYVWTRKDVQPAGATDVKASDVDSETATNGQVLTANGQGGASWQNPSGGSTLYRHSMTMTFSSSAISTGLVPGIAFELICSRESKFNTFADYVTYVKANGPLRIPAVGYVKADNRGSLCQTMRILTSSGYETKVEFYIGKFDSSLTADNVYADHTTDTFNLTDTVTPV